MPPSWGSDSIGSKPIGQHRDETQGGEEISREFVVARGDASPVLETTEAALDDVASFVGFLVVADALPAIGFARDDGLDSAFFEEGAERIGVITLVGNKLGDAGDQAHAGFRDDAIGSVAGRQHEGPWTAFFIDNRMDFAVPAAFGDADRLRLGPPFPPPAQR
jgi:hypothetical protein